MIAGYRLLLYQKKTFEEKIEFMLRLKFSVWCVTTLNS